MCPCPYFGTTVVYHDIIIYVFKNRGAFHNPYCYLLTTIPFYSTCVRSSKLIKHNGFIRELQLWRFCNIAWHSWPPQPRRSRYTSRIIESRCSFLRTYILRGAKKFDGAFFPNGINDKDVSPVKVIGNRAIAVLSRPSGKVGELQTLNSTQRDRTTYRFEYGDLLSFHTFTLHQLRAQCRKDFFWQFNSLLSQIPSSLNVLCMNNIVFWYQHSRISFIVSCSLIFQ